MNRLIRSSFIAAWVAAAMFFSVALGAQQKPQSVLPQRQSYDPSREVSLQGVVLSFTENSSVPPLGAHVSVQTSSGTLDVHLGSAKLLQASHFTLVAGDSVRIVGENLPFGGGSQFFARIIQKGNQSVALRSARGFPLRPNGKQAGAQ
jgi:DNA/RNA endonuclease YhcR with UshA esterase domain